MYGQVVVPWLPFFLSFGGGKLREETAGHSPSILVSQGYIDFATRLLFWFFRDIYFFKGHLKPGY